MSERMAQNVEHLSDVLPAGEATAEQIVRHETDLASFPEVSLRLKAEVESPKATITTLAQLISQDMSLSAKLLKLANSPLYNFSEPVESIQRAVTHDRPARGLHPGAGRDHHQLFPGHPLGNWWT